METAEKSLNVSINKSSLKDDLALLKIPSVLSIVELKRKKKQDLSYLIQLIKDEAEPFEQLQSKNK